MEKGDGYEQMVGKDLRLMPGGSADGFYGISRICFTTVEAL